MFDVPTLRKEFPTLARELHGHRLVYLDSAATSQTPNVVLDAMDRYYRSCRSNVNRGVYLLAEEATDLFESARAKIAAFVGADVRGLVFAKNATEALNLVAYAWVRRNLGVGDVMLTTTMEHHANLVPFTYAAKECGFEIRHIPLTDDGKLDLGIASELVADGRVKFVAVAHVSNVLGTINDVAAIRDLARAANPDVVVSVDGTQAVPHMPVDLADLDVDFYAFTGHKMLGPTGIGALAARPALLESMEPFLSGGDMILDVTLDGATWNEIPHKFEAGTPMIAEAVGLGAAVDFLGELGMHAVREHEKALTGQLLAALQAMDGVTIYGPTDVDCRGGTVSFAVDGVHPHDVGSLLGGQGVCVRVGHHCAKPLMRCLGVNATARASVHVYNDIDDIEPLIDGIRQAQAFFAR